MSVTYNTSVLNNRLQQVINAIDAGAGNGILQIGTSGMSLILSTIILAKPSGTIAGGILTLANVPLTDGSAAGNGTAAVAQITDSTGTIIISGLTVGTTGTDMIMNTTAITTGDVVSLTSGTITGH